MEFKTKKEHIKGKGLGRKGGAWKGMERPGMDVRGHGEGRGQVGKRRMKGDKNG